MLVGVFYRGRGLRRTLLDILFFTSSRYQVRVVQNLQASDACIQLLHCGRMMKVCVEWSCLCKRNKALNKFSRYRVYKVLETIPLYGVFCWGYIFISFVLMFFVLFQQINITNNSQALILFSIFVDIFQNLQCRLL